MQKTTRHAKTHSICLVCQSEELHILNGYEKDHLCQCQNCGFVSSKAIPTEQELVAHYKGYGRNDYLSPITIKRCEELLDRLEPYRNTNRILDWGCGIGYFLEVAKRKGWEVFGTEYTNEAVRICQGKGINMFQGTLDKVDLPVGYFDVITSFEVIEHINNPLVEVERMDRQLRPGGIIYHTTPNFNSLLRYYLKEEYNVIAYPEHLSYYTPKTLTLLFQKFGYNKQLLKTTGISLTRFKKSKKKSDEPLISASSTDEKLRHQAESKWYMKIMKTIINWSLTQ